ncbi:GIN domain-containing protein [Runella sp.]|uniref:GIN domain-containing protein n=1 Tax=Runella sp. TaxID=1960881 RepID=UPI003D0ACCEF
MRNIVLISILFSLLCPVVKAQRGPLRGLGKVHLKSYDVRDFDKIRLEDLDGKIEVEIGKPFSVKIEIDENLALLLEVNKEEKEGVLSISLKGNYNNKMYIEDTHIKVKITMPEASVIQHRGNSALHIAGIAGRYFRLENDGNGDVQLQGSIDALDIKKNGNGEVKAKNLVAKTAKVKSYGNGNVWVNAQISLTAHGSGNNSVLQCGPGKIEPLSGITGNGSVRSLE